MELKLFDFSVRKFLLCSSCFGDQGLKLDAVRVGFSSWSTCPTCRSKTGKKLGIEELQLLVEDFFVNGTRRRELYGSAPAIQFNQLQPTSVEFTDKLKIDADLLSKIGVGFFHYGPRLWMIGEIEPLKDLQTISVRDGIIERILTVFPETAMPAGDLIYRLRTKVVDPTNSKEYDGQPVDLAGKGRLDSSGFPMLYASQDIRVCIHECRATVDDDIYVGTLTPKRQLRLLDLTHILDEEAGITEFESLDLAVNMLFLAGEHAYDICRRIALLAKDRGFDGIVYPSYFSLLQTGSVPFQTAYGLSYRRFEKARAAESRKIVRNVAIFGRPVEAGLLDVVCINKLVLRRVDYDIRFGPVNYS